MKEYKLTITGTGTPAELVESLQRVIARIHGMETVKGITIETALPVIKYIIQEVEE